MSVKASNTHARLVFGTNSFTWNGREVVVPSVANLAEVFGPPDRTAKLMNHIHTWDSLGIYGYVEPSTKQVITLAVMFRKADDYAFMPSSAFTGEIVTPWGTLTAASTRDDAHELGFESGMFGAEQLTRKEPGVVFYADFKPDFSLFQICREEA